MDICMKRTPNFSPDEAELLMGLAKKYRNIVECKRMDNVTNLQKDGAWKRIEQEFNANSPSSTYRCDKTLKVKYYNVKKSLKKSSGYKKSMHSSENRSSTINFTKTASNSLKKMDVSYDDLDPNNYKMEAELIMNQNEDSDNPKESPIQIQIDDTHIHDPDDLKRRKNSKLRRLRNSLKCRKMRCACAKLAALKYKLTQKKFAAEVKAINAEHKKKMQLLEECRNRAREKHYLELEILKEKCRI